MSQDLSWKKSRHGGMWSRQVVSLPRTCPWL